MRPNQNAGVDMMKFKLPKSLLSFVSLFLAFGFLVVTFQNCSPGFQSVDQNSLGLAELSQSSDVPVGILDADGKTLAEDDDLIVDVEYSARIVGTRVPTDAVVTWTATASPGAAVHLHPGANQTISQLHCEASGLIYLSVQIAYNGQSYTSRQRTLPCSDAPVANPGPTPGPGAGVVEFRIPAGTNNGPWNTLAAPVNVRIGQILRIINDDSVPHRLHTGGAPCPHQPSNSAPGASFDCVVTRAIVPTNGGTYDHNFGTGARFYINATP